MAVLDLIYTPNPLLKQISKIVDKVDADLQKFLDDMLETMYAENGAGLAAVQVGVLKRIFVIDVSKHDHESTSSKPYFFINPEIIEFSSEKFTYDEGCLSYPGAHFILERPKKVTVKFLDYHGKPQQIEADDIFARAILHENDHLNGITMPDYMSPVKRDSYIRKVEKFLREKKAKK